MHSNEDRQQYEVVLFRRNGRYVKSKRRPSKYAAKRLQDKWEEKYDSGYYVEVRPTMR